MKMICGGSRDLTKVSIDGCRIKQILSELGKSGKKKSRTCASESKIFNLKTTIYGNKKLVAGATNP